MTHREAQEPTSSFRMFLAGAAGVIFTVLLLAGYDGSRDLARLKARESQLEARLRQSDSHISELRDRIVRLRSDPAALEKIAREQLGLARPGEVVVILPVAEQTPPAESTAPSTP